MSNFPIQQGLFKYDVIDYYAILGCPLDATPQQIRQSYLKIAFKLHPDTAKRRSEAERGQASKLFSKFVNPAYEVLSREAARTEHLLIVGQTAKNLIGGAPLTFTSPEAQQLQAATQNLELVYRKILTPISKGLYEDFQTVFPKIAQISEYNLIFLLVKEGQGSTRKGPVVARGEASGGQQRARQASAATVIQPRDLGASPGMPGAKVTTPPSAEPAEVLSPLEKSLRRAREHYDRHNYDQAISELREALKLNPKDAQTHCLLGMAYLKSKMLTMAKVHIKTAGELNPSDPMVAIAKQELAKHTNSGSTKGGDKSNQGGFFGSLFGKKK